MNIYLIKITRRSILRAIILKNIQIKKNIEFQMVYFHT